MPVFMKKAQGALPDPEEQLESGCHEPESSPESEPEEEEARRGGGGGA